jgi:predicted RND superfamily exporter protein
MNTLKVVAIFRQFYFIPDLKIDTVTCTVLIVCIGLSVDFSAHVVHSYMHQSGESNRANRVTKALVSIAPAVLHGGFSTFLAVVLLSVSDVYVLKTFFKVITQKTIESSKFSTGGPRYMRELGTKILGSNLKNLHRVP